MNKNILNLKNDLLILGVAISLSSIASGCAKDSVNNDITIEDSKETINKLLLGKVNNYEKARIDCIKNMVENDNSLIRKRTHK